MRPKKSLGQNFLINKGAAQRIAQLAAETHPSEILEIGGGRGDLTVELLKLGLPLKVVEIDRSLLPQLHQQFDDDGNFTLVESDILKLNPREALTSDSAALVGNIPYNITSPILEWMISHRACFPHAVLMMQREVADRVAAEPGSKQFGSLTVFVQLFYECSIAFTLKPGSFFPPPKVSSAVIKFRRRLKALIEDDEYDTLRRLTSACFRWRRKQLGRILRDEYSFSASESISVLESVNLNPASRPEQLQVEDFVRLSRELGNDGQRN